MITPDDPIKEQKTIGVLGDFQLPCLATGEKGSAIVNQLKHHQPSTPHNMDNQHIHQWIGFRENLQVKAPYLMGKSMVSGVDFP